MKVCGDAEGVRGANVQGFVLIRLEVSSKPGTSRRIEARTTRAHYAWVLHPDEDSTSDSLNPIPKPRTLNPKP